MNLKAFLGSRYNSESFESFIKERFYGLDIYDSGYTDDFLSESEKKSIDAYRFLGKSELDDGKEIGFFEFKSQNTNIENKRVGYNAILKKLAYEEYLDGAIASFYHPDGTVWRLSFLGFEYDEGKAKVTNLKRFTYVLGEDVPVKTPFEQLKNLKYPTYIELEEAFGVEAITKEFYRGLIKKYEKLLSNYLSYPNDDENSKKEFAIRLIGRILFMKFLNKKHFVSDNIFEICDDYYAYKLEPLFFEQLNTPKNERKEEFRNDAIPFLNGGLFEPLHLDFYEWSSVSNKYINMLKIDNKFFVELYEYLEQYNFTIDENSIEDNDLSIDPEMLGRIFENLLAEINPETKKNARKATGSYYTPREIVEYMVNSSLLEYLTTKTDIGKEILKTIVFDNIEPKEAYEKTKILSAIFELKILDPACGSGAFPMGVLQKIVKILNLIDEDASIWFKLQSKAFKEAHKNRDKDYIRKLSIIKNSIFGVDIQPIAIEISKLRFFLSLIVEEEGEPEPLPNLEFKFVCANSLLPKPKTTQLASLEYYMLEGKLLELKNEYFEASGERKNEIKKEYRQTQKEMFEEEEATNLLSALENRLTDYNPFDPLSVAGFFDSDFMFNIKEGFDIIIGNPPYGVKLNQEHKELYKKIYSNTHMRTPETFNYFISMSFSLLNDNGYLSFIVPNNLLFQNEFEKIRKLFLDKTIDYVINLGDGVFESASVPTCIFGVKNISTMDDYFFKYMDIRDKIDIRDLSSLEFELHTKNNSLKVPSFIFGVDTQTIEIIEKVKEKSYLIDDIALEVASGISTGGDKIFRVNENTIGEHNLENEILHNVLVGREINRYEINSTNHKIIYTARDTEIDDFSNIKAYLLPFKEKLETRSEAKKGILPWYAMNRQRYLELFTEPKILLRQTADSVIASFDESGFFVLDSILIFQIDRKFDIVYKFALAVLNSKLTTFIYRNLTQEEGRGFAQVKPKNIRKLFIPKTSKEKQKLFIILVDYIMWLKAIEERIDNYVDNEHIAKLFEDVIDAMVLELYFKEEMKKAGFDFIAHATKLFRSIENLSDSETKDIINNAYQSLREKDNPIRNDLQLLPIRVPMVAPILESI